LAFASLSGRVNTLPDVVVGPVLRLVLPDQVNVFFALSTARKVTLEVFGSEFDGTGLNRIMVGTRSTTKIADKLHVVCVTATGTQALQPDNTYYYDAKFGPPGDDATEASSARRLYTSGVVRDQADKARGLLTYPGGPSLPSFSLPPSDVSHLRFLHASCRKPHAPGNDALPTGDQILASAFTSPAQRVHQLFLTGDQIYADDVAIPLLFMLQDAATALGFPVEQLPVKGGNKAGSALRASERGRVVEKDAGFTSGEAGSHLMTFADFALMYAFAWSDVLWPSDKRAPDDPLVRPDAVMPRAKDVFPTEWAAFDAEMKAYLTKVAESPGEVTDLDTPASDPRFLQIDQEAWDVATYCSALPKVRRLLANTPTLMIFDDHEITDDWNLNLRWEKRVYDPDPPQDEPTALGRAVIRNGLTAYALFQAWGNTPGQFDASVMPKPPGAVLLEKIGVWDGQPTAAEAAALSTCVGIPESFTGQIAVKPTGSLVWNYAYRWAAHELIVLDTRTERGAVSATEPDAPPALILKDTAFDAMARPSPAPGPDTLVVVVAPGPVFGVPLHEATARYIHAPSIPLISPHAKANPGMDPEHWALTPYAREHLLGSLLTRPAAGADGIIRSRVVLLGGDVHHGSAVLVRYHATNAYRYPGTPVEGVVAQLTSSALKNQSGLTLKIEKIGFATRGRWGDLLVGGDMPITEVSGWNNPTGASKRVGTETMPDGTGVTSGSLGIDVEDDPGLYEYTYGSSSGRQGTYTLAVTPDWSYEVRPQRGVLVGATTPASIATASGARDDKVRQVAAAAKAHKLKPGRGQVVVGHNNLGDVSFSWGAGDSKRVVMDLWWRPEDDIDPAPFTRFDIPLENGSAP